MPGTCIAFPATQPKQGQKKSSRARLAAATVACRNCGLHHFHQQTYHNSVQDQQMTY
jgi:hypothetical protein